MKQLLALLLLPFLLLSTPADAARQFASNANNKLEVGSAITVTLPITLCTWAKFSAVDRQQILMAIETNGSINNYWAIGLNSTGHAFARTYTTGPAESVSAGTISDTTTYHHICGVFTSSSSRTVYLDNVAATPETSTRAPTGMNRTTIGLAGDSSLDLFAKVAHPAMWPVALSAGDISTLYGGAVPSSVQTPNGYWALTSNTSPEPDSSSGANPLTVTGATYTADEPPLSLSTQNQTLTSVSPTSPCARVSSPAIASTDIVTVDKTTFPSGFPTTLSADCNVVYPGDGSLQSISWSVFDTSAGGTMAGSPAKIWFNNQPPVADVPMVTIGPLPTGSAMTDVPLGSLATDPEGGALTCSSSDTGTGTGSNKRPAGTSISGCTWSGTPTTEGSGSFSVTLTDPPGDSVVVLVNWLISDQQTIPDCTGSATDVMTCINLYEGQLIGWGLTAVCSNTVAAGIVISQTPAAGENIDPDASGSFTISRGRCSSVPLLRLRARGGLRSMVGGGAASVPVASTNHILTEAGDTLAAESGSQFATE